MEKHMKVLIAYDGVHSIENKIRDLKRAGLPTHSDAVVLTVVDVFSPSGVAYYPDIWAPGSSMVCVGTPPEKACVGIEKQMGRAKKKASLAKKVLQRAFPEWVIHAEAAADSPNSAILKKANKWGPDLIVVGSQGGSEATRFFLGSVSRSVLIHSKCSVRIVRRQKKAANSPVHIVIGIDGSEESVAAVNAVAGRSWPARSAVRLVTAFDQRMASAIAFHRLPLPEKISGTIKGGTEKEYIRCVIAPYAKKLEDTGLKVSSVIRAGSPWKILVEEAKIWKADCVFVGARGLGMMNRFLVGSVSNSVASRAQCSVEVVRVPDQSNDSFKK